MLHDKVFELFKQTFPQYAVDVDTWFPNGKNSIRLRMKNRKEFVLTYNSQEDWRLETIDSYIRSMGKETKK